MLFFSPLLVFSTFIPLNSDSGGILSVAILSGLNFRLVSKELFYLCFNKALGESNSEDKFLEAVSPPVKHFQPLPPQEKSDKLSYHLYAPQLAVLLVPVLHGSMEGDSIPWRRERLPTPVFWSGEFHGLHSPWGRKESHNWATFTFREGNGNPLQYSCLENSIARIAWQATVNGIAKSHTGLSNFTSFINSIKHKIFTSPHLKF